MNLVQAQEAVEELLECTICMNPHEASGPRTPKMLPCQHVFCLDCIKNIAERRRLVCPTCRTVHYKAIDDIPNSLILIQLLGRQGRCERKCEICHGQKDDPRSYCKKCIDEIVNRELAKAISLTQSYESDPTRRRVPAQKPTEAANSATNPQPQGNPELARQVPNGINLNRVAAFIDRYFFILMGYS
uniref:E3 ubiquitin-protein ligase RNF183-like n=1 Tax=Styela clava TaxID=7725 RepID=UPI00193A8347|nr:E3 ubiquitin-protein ligase RNF183-like [Styela clava]